MRTRSIAGFCLILSTLTCSAALPKPLDEYIQNGDFRGGMTAYASPSRNSERFSLAVLQALDGLQQFAAGFNRLGINPELSRSIPFLRVTGSPRPPVSTEITTPEKVALLFKGLRTSLQQANTTLAAMDETEFSVEVNVSQARMDMNGDDTVAPDERLLASLGRPLGLSDRDSDGQDFLIRFDYADALWLKGYTHFLIGMLDILTAYDWMPVWNQCAHRAFRNPQPIPAIALHGAPDRRQEMGILDMIAALHEMRLEPVRKDGLRDASAEFQKMIQCSRLCWRQILAETDDDHEWLPSPTQAGPGGSRITAQQIEGWQRILDELDAILDGRKLLAHWRIKPGEGINIARLVKTPPRLDPVLLIQGSALIPYLEEGPTSDLNTWRSLTQPFGPGFTRFALWSN